MEAKVAVDVTTKTMIELVKKKQSERLNSTDERAYPMRYFNIKINIKKFLGPFLAEGINHQSQRMR